MEDAEVCGSLFLWRPIGLWAISLTSLSSAFSCHQLGLKSSKMIGLWRRIKKGERKKYIECCLILGKGWTNLNAMFPLLNIHPQWINSGLWVSGRKALLDLSSPLELGDKSCKIGWALKLSDEITSSDSNKLTCSQAPLCRWFMDFCRNIDLGTSWEHRMTDSRIHFCFWRSSWALAGYTTLGSECGKEK